ncbi:hypothetical protein DFH27DRAFT_617919 [Peziza echinospora]|nr:hypothetical protein DFH27DRAFT_617919 [Peziza echinospora]
MRMTSLLEITRGQSGTYLSHGAAPKLNCVKPANAAHPQQSESLLPAVAEYTEFTIDNPSQGGRLVKCLCRRTLPHYVARSTYYKHQQASSAFALSSEGGICHDIAPEFEGPIAGPSRPVAAHPRNGAGGRQPSPSAVRQQPGDNRPAGDSGANIPMPAGQALQNSPNEANGIQRTGMVNPSWFVPGEVARPGLPDAFLHGGTAPRGHAGQVLQMQEVDDGFVQEGEEEDEQDDDRHQAAYNQHHRPPSYGPDERHPHELNDYWDDSESVLAANEPHDSIMDDYMSSITTTMGMINSIKGMGKHLQSWQEPLSKLRVLPPYPIPSTIYTSTFTPSKPSTSRASRINTPSVEPDEDDPDHGEMESEGEDRRLAQKTKSKPRLKRQRDMLESFLGLQYPRPA